MGEASLRSTVTRVKADGTPNSGNVEAMVHDVDNYLRQVDGIDERSVRVRRTAKADCLMRAECRATAEATLARAAEGLRRVWLEDIAYEFLQAYELRIEQDLAVLEFVTQIEPSGFYVTGCVEVLAPAGQ